MNQSTFNKLWNKHIIPAEKGAKFIDKGTPQLNKVIIEAGKNGVSLALKDRFSEKS